jgi:hypothetical protein
MIITIEEMAELVRRIDRAEARANFAEDRVAVLEKELEDDSILRGEDAENLLNDLRNHCSPEEGERRRQAAKEMLEEMKRVKDKK